MRATRFRPRRSRSSTTLDAARAYVRKLGGPCVVKADGLAAGQGRRGLRRTRPRRSARSRRSWASAASAPPARASSSRSACSARRSRTTRSRTAQHVVPLAAAQDHKRALDGDRGENTGGMGAYSPAPVFTPAIEKRVLEEIVHPTIRGMARRGPSVPGRALRRADDRRGRHAEGGRVQRALRRSRDAGADVAARRRSRCRCSTPPRAGASKASPRPSGTARRCAWRSPRAAIRATTRPASRSRASQTPSAIPTCSCSTPARERDARADGFVTAGGRVLGVTARGATVAEAQRRAYAACAQISFEGDAAAPRHRGARGRRVKAGVAGSSRSARGGRGAHRGGRAAGVPDRDALGPRRRRALGGGRRAAAELEAARRRSAALGAGDGRGRAAGARHRRRPGSRASWPTPSGRVRSRWCCRAAGASRRASRAPTARSACAARRIRSPASLARALEAAGVGPITATSLNRHGEPPARTRAEAALACAARRRGAAALRRRRARRGRRPAEHRRRSHRREADRAALGRARPRLPRSRCCGGAWHDRRPAVPRAALRPGARRPRSRRRAALRRDRAPTSAPSTGTAIRTTRSGSS